MRFDLKKIKLELQLMVRFLACFTIGICVVVLVGHCLGWQLLFDWHGSSAGMAIPTAVALILQSMAILVLTVSRDTHK